MLIIDLDQPLAIAKPLKIQEKPTEKPISLTIKREDFFREPKEQWKAEYTHVDEKDKLLRKFEEEESYIRHMRALNHQKFFDQLGPDLMPIRGADFSEVYEEQKVYRERLKGLFIKREQVERTGKLNVPKYLTDSELARMGALKHDRSNGYKLINKLKKKLDEAKLKDNVTRITDLEAKIEDTGLKVMQYSHEIKKLEDHGLVR